MTNIFLYTTHIEPRYTDIGISLVDKCCNELMQHAMISPRTGARGVTPGMYFGYEKEYGKETLDLARKITNTFIFA